MPMHRLDRLAERLVAARRAGTRILLNAEDAPKDYDEGFAVQDKVGAALGSPIIGWKVAEVPQGPVIFAPILEPGHVPNAGAWSVTGPHPAGIELEIAFRLRRDVSAGATGDEVLDAVGSAHVAFELCQGRFADPMNQPRHVAVADAMLSTGVVMGAEISSWRAQNLQGRKGRLLVDGKIQVEGTSADPMRALQILPAALGARGKVLRAGQVVITGSLIGMNWLTGHHQLEGGIDGLGAVGLKLNAAG